MTSQKGSAHALLAVGIVVVILGALGFVFWQNFMQKKDTSSAPTNSTTASNTPQTKMGCLESEKLCFSYLSTWNLKTTETAYPAEGSDAWKDNGNKAMYMFPGVTLTPASGGNFALAATTGIGQLGGTCEPGSLGTRYVTKVDKLTANGVNGADGGQQLYAVQLVLETMQGKFTPATYLTNVESLATVGQADGCDTAYGGVFTQKYPTAEGMNLMSFSVGPAIVSTDEASMSKYPSTSSLDEAKQMLESQGYQDAYTVLKSVHYMN